MGNREIIFRSIGSDVRMVESQFSFILNTTLSIYKRNHYTFLRIHLHSDFVELDLSDILSSCQRGINTLSIITFIRFIQSTHFIASTFYPIINTSTRQTMKRFIKRTTILGQTFCPAVAIWTVDQTRATDHTGFRVAGRIRGHAVTILTQLGVFRGDTAIGQKAVILLLTAGTICTLIFTVVGCRLLL